jgi:hypothetical protein
MSKPLKSKPADFNFTDVKMANMQGVCSKPHKWDGEEREYVETGAYQHQDWPKMLYHPEYGKEPKPDMTKFGGRVNTVQEAEALNNSFNEAMRNWNRKNRTKIAHNHKEFDALKKKGWLEKPTVPLNTSGDTFDYESDEI